jgi:hypothetical protein
LPGTYRFSAQPSDITEASRLTIRSTLHGIRGELDGCPLPVSVRSVDECLDVVGERSRYVRVRSGLDEATEFDLATGDAFVIPWATDVATTVNVVLAGDARLRFGDSLYSCSSRTPRLHSIEHVRGSELRITASSPVRVTGIEMVPDG